MRLEQCCLGTDTGKDKDGYADRTVQSTEPPKVSASVRHRIPLFFRANPDFDYRHYTSYSVKRKSAKKDLGCPDGSFGYGEFLAVEEGTVEVDLDAVGAGKLR